MTDEAYAYLGRLRPAVAARFPTLDATRWYCITLRGPGGIAAPANHVWLHARDRVRAIPVWDLESRKPTTRGSRPNDRRAGVGFGPPLAASEHGYPRDAALPRRGRGLGDRRRPGRHGRHPGPTPSGAQGD